MSRCARSFLSLPKSSWAVPRIHSSNFSALPASSRRFYAVQAAGAPRFQVFNRRAKWLQKERAASNPEESRQADYLKDEVAMRLSERLLVGLNVHDLFIQMCLTMIRISTDIFLESSI